jgi:hypothetical protein
MRECFQKWAMLKPPGIIVPPWGLLYFVFRTNKLEIKNRIAMTLMYAAGLTEPGNSYSQKTMD